MFWNRWLGKIVLAVMVLGVAVWATHQKLLSLPPLEFWSLVVGYLAVTEGVWLVWERNGAEAEAFRRRGLARIPRATTLGVKAGDWFYSGGRPRLTDILAHLDAPREYATGLVASLTSPEALPRLHVLRGPTGRGRSALLLRLGQVLAEKGHNVLRVLPGAGVNALETVLHEAGRKRTVYLLVDDIDLIPQASDLLYGIFRSAKRVIVVATALCTELPDGDSEPLAAMAPADLIARGRQHEVQVTTQDVAALVGKLRGLGKLQRQEATGESAESYVAALKHLQGGDHTPLWDRRAVRDLPEQGRLVVALAGAAEVALPTALLADLGAPAKLAAWLKSGLVMLEHGLALLPHGESCLAFLKDQGYVAPQVREALGRLVSSAVHSVPVLAPRLLAGLSQVPELRELATEEMLARRDLLSGSALPQELQRLWRLVWGMLHLEPEPGWANDDYAPARCLLARDLLHHGRYEPALAVYRALASDPVYREIACFNAALALAHLDRYSEADEELGKLRQHLAGVHFLKGLIAEKRGDMMVALDHYESSRKADELTLLATQRLAFTYLRTGAPRAAIPLFESLLARTPRRADLYGGLAVAHLHSGTSQRAVAQSARAIQAGVDPATARKAVARAFRDANAYDRMVTELEAVVSYSASDREAWGDLAMGCRWLGRFQREEQCLSQIRRCDGNDRPETMLRLARCYRDQGRFRDALDTLLPLTQAAEPPSEALLLGAELAGSGGHRDLQRQLAEAALARGDDSGWAQFWLADSGVLSPDEQRDAYRRAIQILETRHAHGMPHRLAAALWQAVWVAATKTGDESSAERALHHARQDATICKAIGSEIESVTARRSVPPDVFLEELPDPLLPPGLGVTPNVLPPAPQPQQAARPVFLPTRAHGRGTLRI
jgi:tetratricopeptide (TPR) repeat protein